MEIKKDLQDHCSRVAELSVKIAKHYGLDSNNIVHIFTAAKLHDVGKAYLNSDILYKKGRLTAAEMDHIKMHPLYSCRYAFDNGYKESVILKAVLHHHEDYDGKGYPGCLNGEDIPIGARIIRIADYFDALTHDRVYRNAYSVNEAIKILKRNRHQLDPELLAILLKQINVFANVPHS